MFSLSFTFFGAGTAGTGQLTNFLSTSGVILDSPGSAITSWSDTMGNTFSSAGAGSGTRPIILTNKFQGTKPSVYIEASGTDFLSNATSLLCNNGVSIFIVFKGSTSKTALSTTGNVPYTILGNTSSTNARAAFGLSGPSLRYSYKTGGTWTNYNGTTTTLTDGNVHTIAVVHNTSGALSLYSDNVSRLSTTGVTFDTTTAFNIIGAGINNTDAANDCNIAQIYLYNGVLATADLTALHSDAQTNWV